MIKLKKFILIAICCLFYGWGSVGHKIINRYTTLSFPTELNFLLSWADSLANHGSDADIRKGWDPEEDVKHYIDIDNYSEFLSNGRITHNFDSLVIQYGYSYVKNQGILPWAILQTVDSLTAYFSQHNWQKAMLTAADLGHYIGDCHMPLHITRNYNGQYTNQYGIHSRYESTMIGTYQQQIFYDGDTVNYVSNIEEFIFEMIYKNYGYVDSLLQADLIAKSFAGGNYNSNYYSKLWGITKEFTIKLFDNASYNLACLIYTAWNNAGKPVLTNVQRDLIVSDNFILEQNFPNPFNPITTIGYFLKEKSNVKIILFNSIGEVIIEFVNEEKDRGYYKIEIDGTKLSSGIYFYQLQTKNYIGTKKMILLR
jgi:hypothetical protein